MARIPPAVSGGYYSQQQIGSRDPLIAWSHWRRFQTALVLARPFAGGRVLDYGCGDGTLLGLLQTGGAPPALAVGAEIDPRVVADCRQRFASVPGLRFETVTALDRADEAGSYDAVFCMEVLEHVDDPLPLLARFERLLKPRGTLVISVPVETGLPLLVKQLVRRVAGWRGIGHYPGTSSYTPRELVASVFAGSAQHIARPAFDRGDGTMCHDHKGFNWRVLRALVAARFDLVDTLTSPFDWTGPGLGTQVWFVARRRAATFAPANAVRVAVVADLREEGWHSMDAVAELSLLNGDTRAGVPVETTEVRPAMVRRLTRSPLIGDTATADIADRILNRVWDYPRWLRRQGHELDQFDLFHIMDHSYAHLASHLPPGRSVVTCHDLEAFQGAWRGSREGTFVQRALGRQLLAGMRGARKILCVSQATCDELVAAAIVPADRIVVLPNGVHPSYTPRPERDADDQAGRLLGPATAGLVELLHVGSTIPRKRIDVLLNVVAALRGRRPHVRLIRVGGPLTADQRRLIGTLGLDQSVTVVPFVERRVLASIYRRAALVLQPSAREGFGLPVAEAMTCGTPVLASDLPALREVGGLSATYCPVGDVERWTAAAARLLDERANDAARWQARRTEAIAWARRFDWHVHAEATLAVYREVLATVASDTGRGVART
jgi:glycosyltransferase involved in cell wall biosynthesis/SAM-dependent methyltransferase